jgi:hypothetical protein
MVSRRANSFNMSYIIGQELARHDDFDPVTLGGSGSRLISIEKSIALIMPSPNSSWINSLIVVP